MTLSTSAAHPKAVQELPSLTDYNGTHPVSTAARGASEFGRAVQAA
jgi:hypothetical protein